MKGTLSKVLIVIGVLLIVAAILWWAIAVNLLVKFPDDVNVTPVYEGDVDIYQDPLTGRMLEQPLNCPLRIERHYESVAGQSDSNRAVVYEVIKQHIRFPEPIGEQVIEEASQYVIDRKSIENLDDPRSWAFEKDILVNRAGSFYLSFPMEMDKDKEYQIFENKVAGVYPMTKQADKDEDDLEGLRVYLFEALLESTGVTREYLGFKAAQEGYPTAITFDELAALVAADGVDIASFMALLNATLTPEEKAELDAALSQPIELSYKYYTGGKVAVEPKTGSLIRLYDVTEGMTVKPEAGMLFESLQSLLARFAKAHPEQLSDPVNQLFRQLVPLLESEPNQLYEAHYSQTDASVKESAQDAKDAIGKINWVKVYIPWILLIIGAAVLVGGLLMGGNPAPLEEEGAEAGDGGEAPEE